MFNDSIIFRRAVDTDSEEIWYLLHAESKMIAASQILEQIDQLYVLEYQKRILGVLCGTYSNNQVNILWVTVHPLYPENSLQEVMIQQFSSIFCRIPDNFIRKTPSPFLKKLWKYSQELLLFFRTEGAIDGVQD